MRRLLATAAAAGLAIVALAPHSSAQENPAWAGSRITTPAAVASATPPIEALLARKYDTNRSSMVVRTYLTTPGGLPDGCGAAGEHELPTSIGDVAGEPDQDKSTATGSTPCNGTYLIRITAALKGRGLLPQSDPGITLNGEVKIVTPPGNVGTGTGAIEGAAVVLSWPVVSPMPLDLLGYRVYRIVGDDATKLGDVAKNELSFTDTAPPPEGGTVTYQVKAVRKAPGGDVESLGGGKIVVEGVPVGTTTSTTTAPGGGDGGADSGSTDGGTAGTDGGGGTTAGTDGGGGTAGADGGTTGGGKKKGGRTFAPLDRGRVGVGTKAPRLGIPSGSNLEGLLTEDSGFDEELDYGDGLASGGEDGLSSIDYEDGTTGKGMAVPVATGFVFAAWAFHLRYLARAARPVKAAPRYSRR